MFARVPSFREIQLSEHQGTGLSSLLLVRVHIANIVSRTFPDASSRFDSLAVRSKHDKNVQGL